MKVKIKKTDKDAIIPKYAKEGDCGLDLTAMSYHYDDYGNIVYDTGLAFEIPEGFVGMVFPRSSVSKNNQILANCVGIIDSGYRGSVMLKFKPIDSFHQGNHNKEPIYNVGDRIGQIIILPFPQIQFEEVEELSDTERGTGGYGSTGK